MTADGVVFRVIGNLVGRITGALADLLRDVVERRTGIIIGQNKFAATVRVEHGRALLHGQLIEREMRDAVIGDFAQGFGQFRAPSLFGLVRPRVN